MITLDDPKLCSTLQPINQLPIHVFVLIPRFFTTEKYEYRDLGHFPQNKPLITMTHVCRSWRDALLSIPSLWTKIDFSMSTKSQQEAFLCRSGKQPLNIYHYLEYEEHIEPFLSITSHNLFRIQELYVSSCLRNLAALLRNFSAAPELKYLTIENDSNISKMEINLPKIFGGQMPKLTSLELYGIRTNLRDFSFPSLARFTFSPETTIIVQDLTSFFERCPSLEFVQIDLSYIPQPFTPPPRRRVCLAALQELRLNKRACTTGLLDHLTLPKCAAMMLKGEFTGATLDSNGYKAAHIHPSSIDHLPVTRGITKAVAMPYSCVFSGPNGNLRFWCFEARKDFDSDFFTSFSPISVLQIRELWVGQTAGDAFFGPDKPWKQTTAGVCGAFTVLTEVEDLTIVSCETKSFFTTLGMTVDSGMLLPRLRRLTVYVGFGDLDVSTLIRCAKARKGHSLPLGEVTVVWEEDPVVDVVQEVESLREFVGELAHRVGEAPKLSWKDEGDTW